MNTKVKIVQGDDEFDFPMMVSSPREKVYATPQGDHTLYEYYLAGEIKGPELYTDLCHALRSAAPGDFFVIYINSGGGQVRTGDQIINAIKESEATVIGAIEHGCGSMATFIFLACDDWYVSDRAEWFSHTISSGSWGKEHETYASSEFLHRQTIKRLQRDYANFLTDAEIADVIKGTDIYLDAEEIDERLKIYAEALDARLEEEGEGEIEQPSIADLIKQAVREVMDEREAEKIAA